MTKKPEATIRDGAVKATIWRNSSEKGDYFPTTLTRTYKDQKTGEFRESNSFSGSDLLKVQFVAGEAYQQTKQLRLESQRGQSKDVDQARETYREQSDKGRDQSNRARESERDR